MQTHLIADDFDPFPAALPIGDDVVFDQKFFGGDAKSLFVLEFAAFVLALQFKIPVFGEVLGLRQAFFLGADAMIFAAKKRGALPIVAVVTFINVQLTAHKFVLCHAVSLQAAEGGLMCHFV